jgi:hypothetical protein
MPTRPDIASLAAAVQANCDFADALHAREKSLCTYLLGMREYFRWSAQLAPGTAPDRARLSAWIAAREQEWDALRDRAGAGFAALPLAGGVDPFDERSANRELDAHGLVYGAGIGLFGAPMFFLARRQSSTTRAGARVIVAGTELARGITAAPATSRDSTIVIRGDALRRWLWTRAESALRGPRASAFAHALRAYGAADHPATAVERMAEAEAETLILHELGELRAGELLGPEWEDMLAGVDDRRTEVVLRAVRDVLADCLHTLPELIARGANASLLVWFATFDGLRRALAPDFADAYDAGTNRLDVAALGRAIDSGRQLWSGIAAELLDHWRDGGAEAVRREAARLAAGQ